MDSVHAMNFQGITLHCFKMQEFTDLLLCSTYFSYLLFKGAKMSFSIPSLPRYLTGLSLVAVFSGIVYFTQQAMGISELDPYVCIIIGLFAGQFLGSFVSASNHSATSTTSSSSSATSTPGENKTIYVGNISYNANRKELEDLFSEYGDVHSVRIMTDKHTRKSRGYGFVEMDGDNIYKAIDALNGYEFKGRNLKINEATERSNKRG